MITSKHTSNMQHALGCSREWLSWCTHLPTQLSPNAILKRQAIRDAAAAERAATKERCRAALAAPLRIAIDLDFDGLMTLQEVGWLRFGYYINCF